MTDTKEERIAFVHREMERMTAHEEALTLAPRRVRTTSGPSVVFSLRLDRDEVAALEAHSAVLGIGPTVLARNLIRTGLAAPHGEAIAVAVDRLNAAVDELRAAVN